MNYVKELNAFIDWLEINPLEPTTQALWLHLMAICNKSGWPTWFTVANLTLQAKLGVTDKTLAKHRNILIQKERIEYVNQGKKQAGKYRIIPFLKTNSESNTEEINGNIPVNHSVNYPVNRSAKGPVNYPTLYKLNKTKQNNDVVVANTRANEKNPFQFYQENFGVLSPLVAETLGQWTDDLGDELVIEAMKRSVLANKSFNYAVGILKDWYRKNYRSLADVEAADREFQRKRQSKPKARTGSDQYDNLF